MTRVVPFTQAQVLTPPARTSELTKMECSDMRRWIICAVMAFAVVTPAKAAVYLWTGTATIEGQIDGAMTANHYPGCRQSGLWVW